MTRIDSGDGITGATYGGVSMSAVTTATDTGGEPGFCKVFFLGSGVPTGAKTVQVTTTTGTFYAGVITVTCATDTTTTGVVKLENDGTLSEQNVDDGSPGAPSMRYAGGFSGLNTPPSVGANSTSLQSIDDGSLCAIICRESTAGQGSRPVGFSSATTDDRAIIHIAIKEV